MDTLEEELRQKEGRLQSVRQELQEARSLLDGSQSSSQAQLLQLQEVVLSFRAPIAQTCFKASSSWHNPLSKGEGGFWLLTCSDAVNLGLQQLERARLERGEAGRKASQAESLREEAETRCAAAESAASELQQKLEWLQGNVAAEKSLTAELQEVKLLTSVSRLGAKNE